MASIPLELPVKPSEAAALADTIFQQTGGRPLSDDIRNRLSPRVAAMEFDSLQPHLGSLQKDPVHSSSYFIAVDGLRSEQPQPLLLHIALASSPVSALFRDSILIGRMRPGGGREVVVNAIPFAPADTANIWTFARQIDRAFLPRPQGARATLVADIGENETAGSAAFDAFRTIYRNGWGNMAALRGGITTAIWAAVRAGWREPYTVEAPVTREAAGLAATRDFLLEHRDYTRFRIYGSPGFTSAAADFLQQLKSESDAWKNFDLEVESLSSVGAANLVQARLRSTDDIDAISAELAALAASARQANVSLSFDFTESGVDAGLLQAIGKASAGRFSVALAAAWNPRFLNALPDVEPDWSPRKLSARYLLWAATQLRG